MGIYNDKHRLFQDYVKELNTFAAPEDAVSESDCAAKCESYISSADCTWKNIFAPDTGELVGFLIYGKTGAVKHPDADRSIEEAYVAPKYRRQGLMSDVVRDYETRHKCRYNLIVQKGNDYAKGYWERLFEQMGYGPIELDKTYIGGREDVLLMGFAPVK